MGTDGIGRFGPYVERPWPSALPRHLDEAAAATRIADRFCAVARVERVLAVVAVVLLGYGAVAPRSAQMRRALSVQRLEIADRSALKSGAAVAAVAATKQPDSTFTAARIDFGRGDVVP